jgi:hypothetical protein
MAIFCLLTIAALAADAADIFAPQNAAPSR